MTKQQGFSRWEFERYFSEHSGVPAEDAARRGLEAEACTCADPHCRGWKMTSEDERNKNNFANSKKGATV